MRFNYLICCKANTLGSQRCYLKIFWVFSPTWYKIKLWRFWSSACSAETERALWIIQLMNLFPSCVLISMLIRPIVQIFQKESYYMNCTKINLQAPADAGLCKGISILFTIYKVLGCHSNLWGLKGKIANQMFSPCKQDTCVILNKVSTVDSS